MAEEKGKVGNNSFFRKQISDPLDKAMGWEGGYKSKSIPRALIHGTYHGLAAAGNFATGNSGNAKAELKRSKDVFTRKEHYDSKK